MYLDMTGFSRTGVIEQLVFEGFSTEAAFAADTIAPDWNAECAQKAQVYLDMTGFSREGLIAQLEFEGFEPAQIEAGSPQSDIDSCGSPPCFGRAAGRAVQPNWGN